MPTTPDTPPGSRFKILVVEDDPVVLELLRDIMTFQGFEVIACGDSEAAPDFIAQESLHAIFLDQQMPGRSGLELCHQVRKSALNRATPVVMITGSEDRKLMEGAFAAGVTLFLTKPIDRSRLLNLLKTVRGRMIARSGKP
jgi:CheY-like chemotaxis protein